MSGLPSEVAVYVEGEPDAISVSDRYHVFLPVSGYQRRSRGPRCRFTGAVTKLGFPGSLPYVQAGDRVMVDAVGCRGESVVARRIALQP